ncbi:MAG: phenylalanine--tRNA ligase subunit alpha, partial [Alphaproteobacteria bacterium]|nr:phenylalanine--tRNA ligase subunit alpha [Alphaproteobacteria bacterium]
MDADAINEMNTEIIDEINRAHTTKALEDIRVRALGKSGRITLALKGLADVSPSQRKDMGFKLNQVK